MPAVNLTWYAKPVRRIMRDIEALPQKNIAEIEGVSQQAVSSKILNDSYRISLTKWIQILNLAGYEIKEREDV